MVSLTQPKRTLHLHQARSVGRDGEPETNVGGTERLASVLGGAALLIYGARRRDLPGALFGLVGALLVGRGATGRCRVYDALGIDTSDLDRGVLVRQHGPAAVLDAARALKIEHTITIARSPARLYAFWRRLENLPLVMRHLESVTELSPRRSRWRARGPAGQHVEWDAEIINEVEHEMIAWKSTDEATVPNAGSVHFTPAPGGRGTELRVILEYEPPAGRVGAFAVRLLGANPEADVREDLRRFKQLMEAGEVPGTEGQPTGR